MAGTGAWCREHTGCIVWVWGMMGMMGMMGQRGQRGHALALEIWGWNRAGLHLNDNNFSTMIYVIQYNNIIIIIQYFI